MVKNVFPVADIYAITDSRQNLGRSNIAQVESMLEAGIKVIQYREKFLPEDAMVEECLVIRALTRDAGCCFIVNDHVEVAKRVAADGVHVGQEDLPVAEVRRIVGPEMIIGLSTHAEREVVAAIADGADYIGVGPIFATLTKPNAKPVGLDYLRHISSTYEIAQVAIGGINEKTLAEAVRHGARCCCMVTAITLAQDIPARVRQLRGIIQEARA